MATILAVGRLLLMALLGAAQLTADKGYATEFGQQQDALSGSVLACTGRRMAAADRVCAHRSLPCGTIVLLQNLRTRKLATCTVADRGPYGATLPNGEIVLKIRPDEEGTWRGLIDISPAVARALDLSGREQVGVVYERQPRRRGLQGGQRWARAF